MPGAILLVLLGLMLFGSDRQDRRDPGPTANRAEEKPPISPSPPGRKDHIGGLGGEFPGHCGVGGREGPVRSADGSIIVGGETGFRQIYGARDVTLSTPMGSLAVALEDVRIGGRSIIADRGAAPEAQGDEVAYRRGDVTEKYMQRGATGVEQVFVLSREIESLRSEGELEITVALDTVLSAVAATRPEEQAETYGKKDKPHLRPPGAEAPREQVIEFRNAKGGTVITYGGATAIDAAGRKQPLG
jgi:hypothetical protein